MGGAVKEDVLYCQHCGKALSAETMVVNSFVCLDCQKETFSVLQQTNGTHLAIFLCCASFNIPMLPKICPADIGEREENAWETYITKLEDSGALFEESEAKTFSNGETNIRAIFGKELSETDFAKFIAVEQARIERMPGTEEQRKRWGERPIWKSIEMTDSVYNELDRVYWGKLADFKGATITKTMENTLIEYAKLTVAASYLMERGQAETVQKLINIREKTMESEQMRKKDEKPLENFRVDALVDALEKRGFMENGKLLTLDELIEAMRDTHVKSKKYRYSLDAADQMINDYYNNMRMNADLPIVSELPADLQITDEYGEFEKEETQAEKKIKKALNLTKVSFAKEEGKMDNADRI